MEAVDSIETVVSHKQVMIEIHWESEGILILLKCVLGNPVEKKEKKSLISVGKVAKLL